MFSGLSRRDFARVVTGVVVGLSLTGCSSAEPETPPISATDSTTIVETTTQNPTPSGVATGMAVPALDEEAYVEALCAVDFFVDPESEDPMAIVIGQIRALPAASMEAQAEVDRLVGLLEAADQSEDLEALIEAGAVLSARCGGS